MNAAISSQFEFALLLVGRAIDLVQAVFTTRQIPHPNRINPLLSSCNLLQIRVVHLYPLKKKTG
jgi:hypothetical protein